VPGDRFCSVGDGYRHGGTHIPAADENERPVHTVPESGDTDETFAVSLPFDADDDSAGATHVTHMRGNRDAFLDILAGFVNTGCDLSAPLRQPAENSADRITFALEGLGVAHVDSIEELSR